MTRRVLLALTALSVACAGLAAAPAGTWPIALLYSGEPGRHTAQGFLLGGWHPTGGWQSPQRTATGAARMQSWRLQPLRGPATLVKAPLRVSFGETPCEQTGLMALAVKSPLKTAQIATATPFPMRPRPVTLLPARFPAYEELVRQELVKAGLRQPRVRITTLVRTDLDGNGTQEVLIAATHFAPNPESGPGVPPHAYPGDFSLLLLRWTDRQRGYSQVIAQRTFPRAERGGEWLMPERFDLLNVADLNGDGRMEIVMSADYYEGSSAAVFEWTPAMGLKERLNAGCGS